MVALLICLPFESRCPASKTRLISLLLRARPEYGCRRDVVSAKALTEACGPQPNERKIVSRELDFIHVRG